MHADNTQIIGHYQENYFEGYQKKYGEIGGRANRFLFEKHISPNDSVLDFGCGGGFLLMNLECQKKVGIEINPVARHYCNNVNGIQCHESLELVQDESFDTIISSHCLEHTPNPFELVSIMFKKLKPGGKIVIVVPLENMTYKWTPTDINKHLYSFSPMNLGNILQAVGFTGVSTDVILHKWIPRYDTISKFFGFSTAHHLSSLYGHINRRCVQIKGCAIKPLSTAMD